MTTTTFTAYNRMFIGKAMEILTAAMKKMKLPLDTPFYLIKAEDLPSFEQNSAFMFRECRMTLKEMDIQCEQYVKNYRTLIGKIGTFYSFPKFASKIVAFRGPKDEVVVLSDNCGKIIQID